MPSETNMLYPAQYKVDVLAENGQILSVLRDYGFHIATELEACVYHVTSSIART